MSPARAILLHSPGRKPWVNHWNTFIEPRRGGTSCASIGFGRYVVLYLSVGAFACLGKCRSYGAQSAFICVPPGFHIGLCPHFTLGFAGVPPFQGSLHAFSVSPGFHIGLCPHFTLGFAGDRPAVSLESETT